METKTAEVPVEIKKGPEMTAKTIETPVAETPKKKGMGCFTKFMIVSCFGLLLCCCVTVVMAFVAPKLLVQYIAGGNTGPDTTLTRITASEVNTLITAIENKEASLSDDGYLVMNLTEEEMLALLVDGMKITDDPGAVGVDIEDSYMKLEIELEALLTAMSEGSEQQQDFSALNEIYVSIELGTTEDNSLLTFEGLSLGNTVLDPIINSILTEEIKQGISKSIQDSISGQSTDPSLGDSGIRKLVFIEDAVEMYMEIDLEGLDLPVDEMGL